MQILYIEDDTNNARLVSRYVKSTPHQLVVINTVEEARVSKSHPWLLAFHA